ncbi:Panacea domain-containing protein [Oleomonas cavernae]|nr:Panacea domain-containing protein [Oleomonas cavernae]
MIAQQPGIDLHAMLKACYFADKHHLNKYHRPVFGATYRAMRFGPVPVEIYEMAKGEALWLAELGDDRFPWKLEGYRLQGNGANADLDHDVFSDSDFESLKHGFGISSHMTFNARTSATHGADWQAAKLGTMRYEDMIDDSPRKAEIVADLRQNAAHIRL